MSKFFLNKSTTLQQQFLLVGDTGVISKSENQKQIRESQYLTQGGIKNTQLASIYSTNDAEYGSVDCNIYTNSKGKIKPTSFYYIPTNSLNYIKVDELIKKIDAEGSKTGEIIVDTGKISFQPLGNTENKDSGYIGVRSNIKDKKVKENLDKSFKKWNNTFIFDVEKGNYQSFLFDFKYSDEPDVENYDTMFSIKKKV